MISKGEAWVWSGLIYMTLSHLVAERQNIGAQTQAFAFASVKVERLSRTLIHDFVLL